MKLTIPPLQRNLPITRDDFPSDAYHIWWQNVVNSLIDANAELQSQLAQIQSAIASADEAKKTTARVNSYTVPTNVLHGIDAGANAKIVIDVHTRVYPDDANYPVPDVSIIAGEITGLNYSTAYFVYYDDPTLSNTTPNFIATTDGRVAQVGAGPSRHYVGSVTTPAAGGGSTGGSGGAPPGGGGGPLP